MVRLIVDENLHGLVTCFILAGAHNAMSRGHFHWTTTDWGHVWSLLPEGADWILIAEPIVPTTPGKRRRVGKGEEGKGGGKGEEGEGERKRSKEGNTGFFRVF
jgi:hypothetical protein